ncbi:MAG: hypothetical protein U1F10_00445 [Burkholderiales bacterium]
MKQFDGDLIVLTGELADVDETTARDARHPSNVFIIDMHRHFVRVVVPHSANPRRHGMECVGARLRLTCSYGHPTGGPGGVDLVAESVKLLVTRH